MYTKYNFCILVPAELDFLKRKLMENVLIHLNVSASLEPRLMQTLQTFFLVGIVEWCTKSMYYTIFYMLSKVYYVSGCANIYDACMNIWCKSYRFPEYWFRNKKHHYMNKIYNKINHIHDRGGIDISFAFGRLIDVACTSKNCYDQHITVPDTPCQYTQTVIIPTPNIKTPLYPLANFPSV